MHAAADQAKPRHAKSNQTKPNQSHNQNFQTRRRRTAQHSATQRDTTRARMYGAAKLALVLSNLAGLPSCVLVWRRGYPVPSVLFVVCVVASLNLHTCHLMHDVRHDACRGARQTDWLAALTGVVSIVTIALDFEHWHARLAWWLLVAASLGASTLASPYHEVRLVLVACTVLAQTLLFTGACSAAVVPSQCLPSQCRRRQRRRRRCPQRLDDDHRHRHRTPPPPPPTPTPPPWATFVVLSAPATRRLRAAVAWCALACVFLFAPSLVLHRMPLAYVVGHTVWHVLCGYGTSRLVRAITDDDTLGAVDSDDDDPTTTPTPTTPTTRPTPAAARAS
jgi:hypothetical protein